MHRELRPAIPREQAARLTPDLLAELREIDKLAGADAGLLEAILQTHLEQLAHSMGLDVDAHAQRLERRNLLEHQKRDAVLVARQSQRQSGNAATGDQHSHTNPP